jgi:hypothetical protein
MHTNNGFLVIFAFTAGSLLSASQAKPLTIWDVHAETCTYKKIREEKIEYNLQHKQSYLQDEQYKQSHVQKRIRDQYYREKKWRQENQKYLVKKATLAHTPYDDQKQKIAELPEPYIQPFRPVQQ